MGDGPRHERSFSPSAWDVLRDYGVDLQFFLIANRVDRRDTAIQTVAG